MSRNRIDRIALAALTLLPFIWYFTPIFTEACYYLGDITAQYEPWWSYGHESLREGRFPLWNPFVFGGMPYNVNPESSLFYPLKLPLIFLSFFKTAALLRALNAVVASAGFYLLMRSYRTQPLSAAVGALIFSYGSFMAYEFVHIPYINTAVWFPWQLMALNGLMRRPTMRSALLLAIPTACSFLGGSPGIFLICQMTLFFFFAAAVIRLAVSRRWPKLISALRWLAVSVAVVAGLTLVVLLPTLQFIPHTPRAGGLTDTANYTDFALIPEALDTLLFPWLHARYGAPYPPIYPIFFLNVPFLGVGAVLLALLNLRSRRHAHILPVTAAIVLFSVLMAMGTRTAFFPWLLERSTLFSWFRWPHDYLLMAYIAIAIAAATGFDALWKERGRVRRFGGLAIAYVLLGMILGPWKSSVIPLAAVAVIVAAGMLPITPPRWTRKVVGTVLLIFLAAELFIYGYNLRVYMPSSELGYPHCREAIELVKERSPIGRVAFSSPTGGAHFSGRERFFSKHVPFASERPQLDIPLTDLSAWGNSVGVPVELSERMMLRARAFYDLEDTFWTYPVNGSMLFQYQEISGYDPFAIARVLRLFRELPIYRSWDLFGVEHIVTPHPVIHDRLEPVARAGSLHVNRNRTVLPRVTVPSSIVGPLEEEEVIELLRSDDFDPAESVLFEEPPPPAAGEGSAKIVEYGPERVVVQAEMKRAGFVVLHDVHYPGWRAYVDDVEAAMWRANYIFRAVWLPVGEHRVVFAYRPYPFLWPAWISLLSWTICLVSLLFTRRPR
jgi:hypothetical protein